MSATTVAPPRPPGTGGLGALRELAALRRDQLSWVVDRRRAWGDVFALEPPLGGLGPLFAFACAPGPIRQVLTDPTTFVKASPVYEQMAGVLGDGLLTSEGEDWKAQRRTLQPLFTRRRVAAYGDAFVAAMSSVVDDWPRTGVVDLDRQMQVAGLRSVSVTLFGTDVTDQVAPIIEATDAVSAAVVRKGTAPVRLPSWIPTSDNRTIADATAELRRRFDVLIEQRRQDPEQGDDLLSLLLTVEDPETGQPLSHDEIRDQAGVMLLAGYDTTSTAMTFALHLLGHHPDWQDAVRDEVRGVLDGRAATTVERGSELTVERGSELTVERGSELTVERGSELTVDDAARLELTRRVVDEALRLHPSAYITSRSATTDTELGGYAIPRGGVVATSFHALHRHPDLWPDPDRFDPDRFLPDAVKDRDPYAYLPFGGGPRSCIGNHFALLEATLGIATVVDRVRLTSRTDHVPVTLGITQRPSAPVLAAVQPA